MNFVFTWNNPDPIAEPPNVWPNVKYAIWQYEVGEEGTGHYQGYVMFDKLMSFKQVHEIIPEGIWIQKRKGSHAEAKAYASKEESRVYGPWTYGEEPKQGARSDLATIAEYVKDHTMAEVAVEFPAQFMRYERGISAYKNITTPDRSELTKLIVFWGPPLTGKSTHVTTTYPGAFWLKRGRTGEPWWDGYDGQATVVIDEFYGWIGVDTMSRLIDFTPYYVEHKGKSVKFTSKLIVIISNKSPEEWWSCELYGMRRRLDAAEVHHVRTPLWLAPPDAFGPELPTRPSYPTNELFPTLLDLDN